MKVGGREATIAPNKMQRPVLGQCDREGAPAGLRVWLDVDGENRGSR